MKNVLIIIPAYNEAENLEKLILSINHSEVKNYSDLLIVDDGSNDHTYEIALRLDANAIRLPYNLGYIAALQTGYKYALKQGYNYVIQLDADGQHDVKNISNIYNALTDNTGQAPDVVIGSRFIKKTDGTMKVSFIKRLAIQLFTQIIYFFTKNYITDPTSGLQGINRNIIHYFAQFDVFTTKYPDANIVIQLLLRRVKIVEIPAIMHDRIHGESMHHGLKTIRYMFEMMFSIFIVILRHRFYPEAAETVAPNNAP